MTAQMSAPQTTFADGVSLQLTLLQAGKPLLSILTTT